MTPYESRVIVEHTELMEKLVALRTFLIEPVVVVPEKDMALLTEQEEHMHMYSVVLAKRIRRFAT